ncbi:hypothetical protein ABKN59_009384 [Abortiporus biennis]
MAEPSLNSTNGGSSTTALDEWMLAVTFAGPAYFSILLNNYLKEKYTPTFLRYLINTLLFPINVVASSIALLFAIIGSCLKVFFSCMFSCCRKPERSPSPIPLNPSYPSGIYQEKIISEHQSLSTATATTHVRSDPSQMV